MIAVGGNLAGRFASPQILLEAALECFEPAGLKVLKRSSWWRSASWPDPRAPDYINGVVVVETALDPRATLAVLREIEASFGRRRAEPNAPRTLDLDLIAHGRVVLSAPDLALPHPRAAERLFVMGPLAQIGGHWVHPTLGETAAALAARTSIGLDARPL